MTIREVLSDSTISDGWKKVRDIAIIVALVSGAILNPTFPFVLPALAIKIVSIIAWISSAFAGYAQTDVSKIKKGK